MTALCLAPGCHVHGWHTADCTDQTCKGCLPAVADQGQLCTRCYDRLVEALADIPRLHALLDLEPGRADPAPLGRNGADSRPPLRIDILSEIGPGSTRAHGHYADQLGELPVALTLDTIVRDWATYTGEDEHLPVPTVPQLAAWLTARLGWAVRHHPAVAELYGDLSGLRSRLRPLAYGIDLTQWTGKLPGRCPICRHLTLTAHRGRAECLWPTCQRVWMDERQAVA